MKGGRYMRAQAGVTAGLKQRSAAAELLADSSAILGATLTADLEDVNAVLRTAVLLARTLRSSLSLDVLGRDKIQMNAGEDVSHASLHALLDTVQNQLRKHVPGKTPTFVLEASITAASFFSAGVISVRIRPADTAAPGAGVSK